MRKSPCHTWPHKHLHAHRLIHHKHILLREKYKTCWNDFSTFLFSSYHTVSDYFFMIYLKKCHTFSIQVILYHIKEHPWNYKMLWSSFALKDLLTSTYVYLLAFVRIYTPHEWKYSKRTVQGVRLSGTGYLWDHDEPDLGDENWIQVCGRAVNTLNCWLIPSVPVFLYNNQKFRWFVMTNNLHECFYSQFKLILQLSKFHA